MNAVTTWSKAVIEAEQDFIKIAAADGNLVAYQRESSFALQRLEGDTTLQKCTHESIRNAVVNVANVGLSLSPALKLAYLVPRKLREGGPLVCCLDISYIGLCKLATDSGAVLAVAAEIVRKKDKFTFVDPFTSPKHEFDPFATIEARGEMIGVYCLARLKSGITQVTTLSMEEIAKIRAVSRAANGPWKDWPEEMAKKSVVKRASKFWPRSERLSIAEDLLNQHEGSVAIETELATDADPDAAEKAKAEAEKNEVAKENLRKLVAASTDPDVLQPVWLASLKLCKALAQSDPEGSKKFHAEIRAAVLKRQEDFKVGGAKEVT